MGEWSVGQSVGRTASQNYHLYGHVSRSLSLRLRSGRCGSAVGLAPNTWGRATPRASLERSRPEVGHTSGFTAPAGCPRWGHPGDARGVPHLPPCPFYRTQHMGSSCDRLCGKGRGVSRCKIAKRRPKYIDVVPLAGSSFRHKIPHLSILCHYITVILALCAGPQGTR